MKLQRNLLFIYILPNDEVCTVYEVRTYRTLLYPMFLVRYFIIRPTSHRSALLMQPDKAKLIRKLHVHTVQ